MDNPAGNYNLIHLKIVGGGLLPAVYIRCDGLLKTCRWDPYPREHAEILYVFLYEHLTRDVCVPVLVSVADIIHLSV